MSIKKSLVFAKIPDAGLANMLLTYCEAALYAKNKGLELLVSRWFRFRIGPFIRFEKSKRLYIGNFTAPTFWGALQNSIRTRSLKTVKLDNWKAEIESNCLYIFDETPPYYDFTGRLRAQRKEVIDIVQRLVKPSVWKRVEKYQQPIIGMHIRLGDFKRANITTDIAYFVKALRQVRKQHGEDLPATIFSDGTAAELMEVLNEGNVSLAKTSKDIDDLLLLSKSQYFILSQDSSFGYFAGLISNGELICKPSQKNGPVTEDIPELIIPTE